MYVKSPQTKLIMVSLKVYSGGNSVNFNLKNDLLEYMVLLNSPIYSSRVVSVSRFVPAVQSEFGMYIYN